MAFNKQIKLSTRFNIFVILMILATSFGVTLFVIVEENNHNYEELLNRGMSLADIISKNSDYSLFTEDKKSLQQLADSTLTDANVAYVAILNSEKQTLASKTRSNSVTIPSASASRTKADNGKIASEKLTGDKDGKTYIDILAPVVSVSSGDLEGLAGLGQETNTGPKTIGYVQIGLSQEGLRKRILNLVFSTLLFTAIIVSLGVALTFFITKKITLPIKHLVSVAQDISRGKLKHTIKHYGETEISSLASAIDDMSANLKDMILKITDLASNVSAVTQTITDSPASVLRVVDLQREAIEETVSSINEMDKSISAVSLNSDNLYLSAEEASAAALEMTSSISEVADNSNTFHETAQEAAAHVQRMIDAIKEIAGSLEILSSSSEVTSSSLLDINSQISVISRHSEESVKLAEQVSAVSTEKGLAAVDNAIKGIEEVRQKVTELSSSVGRLGSRSKKIDAIITIINDVADQTSLLALNAAIIAARAGEHGRAFAIVAAEIKDLADKTSNSIDEIAELIISVQEEARASIRMAGDGIASVDKGERLVQEVKGVLHNILESSKTSTDKSKAIKNATAKEAEAITNITSSIKKQAEQVEFITESTRKQNKDSKLVIEAVDKVKALSGQLRRSTAEQFQFSKRISEVSVEVSGQAEQITAAIKDQKRQSGDVIVFTEKIQKTTADLLASAENMNRSIISLRKEAQHLMTELKKFEV